MFVTKSHHKAMLAAMEAKLHEANESHLSSIYQFESRIADLKSQIDDLRKLVFIPKQEPTRELMEADSVISGSEKPVEQTEAERNAYLEASREMDLIVSGNYDQDLLN